MWFVWGHVFFVIWLQTNMQSERKCFWFCSWKFSFFFQFEAYFYFFFAERLRVCVENKSQLDPAYVWARICLYLCESREFYFVGLDAIYPNEYMMQICVFIFFFLFYFVASENTMASLELYTSFEEAQNEQCSLCKTTTDDPILFGEKKTYDSITAHYFCLVIECWIKI